MSDFVLPHLDENVSAAQGVSPGVVQDDEVLLREMYEPYHVADGVVLSQAIAAKDLLCDGFSVHRLGFACKAFLEQRVRDKLEDKEGRWRFVGFARLRACSIRMITEKCTRAFVIIDTADIEDKSHASIYVASRCDRDIAMARKLRGVLLGYLNDRCCIDSLEFNK